MEQFESATRRYTEVTQGIPGSSKTAEMVYVRQGVVKQPLSPCYSGPYRMLERSLKVFQLQMGQKVKAVSADCIKLHTGATLPQPVDPPHRGRPPKS